MKKFTKEELKKMISDNAFGYGTPIRQAAEENAGNYDFDSDTLDVRECVEDAFVYGSIWILDMLED